MIVFAESSHFISLWNYNTSQKRKVLIEGLEDQRKGIVLQRRNPSRLLDIQTLQSCFKIFHSLTGKANSSKDYH